MSDTPDSKPHDDKPDPFNRLTVEINAAATDGTPVVLTFKANKGGQVHVTLEPVDEEPEPEPIP